MLAKMHIGVTSLPDVDDEKYAASSPIKLFEYMASGLPMLATANPCHTDVVGDGSYVFWIDETTDQGILKGLMACQEDSFLLCCLLLKVCAYARKSRGYPGPYP